VAFAPHLSTIVILNLFQDPSLRTRAGSLIEPEVPPGLSCQAGGRGTMDAETSSA
jgi:hypothetical protein